MEACKEFLRASLIRKKEKPMRIRTTSAMLFVGAAAFIVMAIACKKEDPQNAQPGTYPTNTSTYPTNTYPTSTYPTATATTPAAAPAAGMPCGTDNDMQCAFGKCLNGRCGGCTSVNDCKPGATCMQTPLGMACFPGGGATQPSQ
jgi:hypothetical protein